MIYQAIGIGVMVSFAFYEIVGFSPGGIVVPGYIALFLDQPVRGCMTNKSLPPFYHLLYLFQREFSLPVVNKKRVA